MNTFFILNCIACLIAVVGLSYAMFSKHVCDGILIKKALAALALGFAAQAFTPSPHSQLWIACSMAGLCVAVAIRLLEARAKHQPPVFLVF